MSEWTQALRQRLCEALNYLGARIDEAANLAANGESIAAIHAGDSSVEIWWCLPMRDVWRRRMRRV